MSDETERSVELLERLLGDPHLRRRFRNDAAAVLTEAGLPELAAGLGHGGRALMTLEMRESRSSLAGVMVAAAAEGVDLAQFAEHAAPALARDAGAAIHQLMQHPHQAAPKPVHDAAPQQPATPDLTPPAGTPALAQPQPKAPTPADPRRCSTASRRPRRRPAPHSPRRPRPPSPRRRRRLRREHSWSRRPREPGAGTRAPASTPGAGPEAGDRAGRPCPRAPAGTPITTPRGQPRRPSRPSRPTARPVYPGDQATSQQIAAWMGAHAEQGRAAPRAPGDGGAHRVGLRNLSYGDRDSVGFFQMRVGIWDQGAYAGYPSNPELQIQWFIDHAVAVKSPVPGACRQSQQLG